MLHTKRLLFLFVNLCFWVCSFHSVYSQTCTPIYHKTYNGTGDDEGLDIRVTSDKGSIVAGRTTSNSPEWDGFLMRLNEGGSILWSKSFGGTEYDELTKVKQTSDGGFIALGKTKSFGLSVGEAWVVRTDASGNLLWSKHYSKQGQPIRPKHIIQLLDGGYAFAFNTNDSTSQGDGVVVRTDVSGNVIWSKVLDNGNDDGVNYLVQDGNTLLVGGYATVNDREGILMRISVTDGSIMWSKRFARAIALSDEIIQVDKTSQGLSFSASSTWIRSDRNGYNPCFVTLFRTIGDDSILTKRRIDMFTTTYTVAEGVSVKSNDSSFIYLVNDTTAFGWPRFGRISSAGLTDWSRSSNTGNGGRRLKSIDFFQDRGYVLTGFYKDFYTSNRSRIELLKTDITGRTGVCSEMIAGEGTDTTNYDIGSFTWRIVGPGVTVEDISPVVSGLTLSINTLCSDNYCADPDPPHSADCYATFLSHIKGNGEYSFTPYDFEKVNDGYVVFGYNRLLTNIEPMMIRLRSDGSVLWAKTLTKWIHSGYFEKVLTTLDGNLLVKGQMGLVVGNAASYGAILLKITTDGTVLWSEEINREIYDITQTDDGSFVGTTSTPYGFPPMYITLFKMDANGKITWQKQMNDFQQQAPIYRKVLYDGTYFYVAGEFYGTSPQRIAVEKIDGSGNHIWKKVFTVDGFYSSVEDFHIIGDSLYLATYYYDNSAISYMAKRLLAVVKVSKDGQGLNAFRVDVNFAPDSRTYQFLDPGMKTVTKTMDNNFIVADRVPNIIDSSLVLTKFTPIGNILWSRRYDQLTEHSIARIKDDNGSLLFLGRMYAGQVDLTIQHQTLLMRTDNTGLVTAESNGYCHSVENSVSSDRVRLEEYSYYPPVNTIEGGLISTSFVPATQHFFMTSVPSCAITGNCSSVKIDGPVTICNIADTVTYTTRRNAGCTIPALWMYDANALRVTKQTDSTLAVLYKKNGRTFITATLSSGCGATKDSVAISIPAPSTALNLGNDTTICSGTNILLNAHKGFLNYLWQDGSIDSIYKVQQDGKYYVRVMDSCGAIFTDTVIVLPHPPIPIFIGSDRTKCNNDTIHINAPSGFMNYSWSPLYNVSSTSTQNIIVNPTKDTSYFVKAEQTPGCFAYDTVRVKVNHSPKINLGNDTSFCLRKSILLDAGAGFNRYSWSNGSSQQTLSVNKVGTYSVIGTTVDGCNSYDTLKVISVWSLPSPSLDHNTELCQSSTRLLDPGSFSSYLWNDGSTSRKYSVSSTGTYYVEVSDNNGCVNADTVHITTILPPPQNFLPGDTSICSYGSIELKASRSFASYTWSNGSTAPKLIVDKAGSYWLQVRDSKGCAGADTIVVSIRDCMVGLRVPTAFTPNHDATNDIFRALLFGKVKSFELTIYNKWGQIVFYTADKYKGWDGTVGGKDQDPGVFIWMCKYQLEGDKEKIERGTVTLIR